MLHKKILLVIYSHNDVIVVDAAHELDSKADMDDRLYPALGDRVARLRRLMKITQEALGDRVGMSRATVASIEAGRQRVTLDQLYQLACALELDDLSTLVPLEVPTFESIAPDLRAEVTPIQAAQIQGILRSAMANARGGRKRA